MKICTITCHHAVNYGARLQACALSHYLKEQGHEVEVVDYRPGYVWFRGKIWYWPGRSVRLWAKLFLQFRQRYDAVRRYARFENFSEQYLPRTKRIYFSGSELQENPPQADVYVAGSDQIWNPLFGCGTDSAFYLDFGMPETKRISYAASFGLASLAPDCEPFVKNHLSGFDMISVRESSGLDILSSLGYSGCIAADPVFLLSAGEWDALLGCRDRMEPYILVYDVMGCDTIKRVAKSLAKRCSCKIYAVSFRRLGYADRNYTQVAPDRFVELVRNASCVVSNSFHGTAFAMIYHRDFWAVDREDGLNERIHNLLSRCGLQSRLVSAGFSGNIPNTPVMYEAVDAVLQKEISESEAFLKKALQG